MRKKTQRTTRQEEIARSRLAKPRTAPRNLESSDAEQNRGPGMRRAGHGDGERSRRGRAAGMAFSLWFGKPAVVRVPRYTGQEEAAGPGPTDRSYS
jgi:hypothetical protein